MAEFGEGAFGEGAFLTGESGSITDLCNDALAQIGKDPITAIDDGSPSANLCALFLPNLNKAALRNHIWNFAIVRVELAQDATAPLFEWSMAFGLPADCVRVVGVGVSDAVDYKIEGRRLLTNESSVKIVYIARNIDPNMWDPMYWQYLSTRLASKLATPLIHDTKLANGLYVLAQQMLLDAQAVDGQEGTPDTIDTPDLTTDVRN